MCEVDVLKTCSFSYAYNISLNYILYVLFYIITIICFKITILGGFFCLFFFFYLHFSFLFAGTDYLLGKYLVHSFK